MRTRIRLVSRFAIPLLGVFASSLAAPLAAEAEGDVPRIERAKPNPLRRQVSEAWLTALADQRPALDRALRELGRQRDFWRSEPGVERCRRARRALARVDRAVLLAVSDYSIVAATGRALDELDGAIRACSERRYFEFDYRLERARRSLTLARDTARRQARP